ncbi:MAG: hypothetical protein GY854_07440 [Deltaproteobacteria bacterium]|nr:hypothetical protein [Deltaproteobacteria bacterium]
MFMFLNNKKFKRSWLVAIFLLAFSSTGAAQQTEDAPPEDSAKGKQGDADASQQTESTAGRDAELEALKKRVKQLEAKDAARDEEVEGLKAAQEEMIDEQAMAGYEEGTEDSFEQMFDIYGFFDLTFAKTFFDKGSPYTAFIPEKSSFGMSNFNVYLRSRMTETLSALGELRFSFLPLGKDEDYEYIGPDGEPMPDYEYERVETWVSDPFSTSYYRQGGVAIERIHLTYAPVDWFTIIAGRFITPSGIWNVDHGSPVVLPVRLPWMQIRELVPSAQLGVQVAGRLFPTDQLFFDYAITLSNGRGPIDTVQDLDENKGVGLKLKLSYSGNRFRIAAGGYGYYGRYTDSKKVIRVFGLSPDVAEDKPLQFEIVDTSVYDEYCVASDLLIEAFGVRVQSEYTVQYKNRIVAEPMDTEDVLFSGASPLDTLYEASSIGHDVYVLLAYELPLHTWISPVRITPYFMYEYGVVSDMAPYINMTQYIWGLNVKPSPFVVLKAEGMMGVSGTDLFGSNLYVISAQIAVSF